MTNYQKDQEQQCNVSVDYLERLMSCKPKLEKKMTCSLFCINGKKNCANVHPFVYSLQNVLLQALINYVHFDLSL